MKNRIFGLENEYGLIFSPNGKVYLPMEKILGYIFEGLIPNSWPSNAFLVNGARFYQDTGCHPEYSTPECDNVFDLVVHDKAGERLLESCLPIAEKRLKEEGLSGEIYIFKNNTDSMGNTYGCHENYLMRRDLDFWKVTEQLIPFFVTRQVYSGSGKVLKVSGKSHYFISQRAQHIHEKTSSSTTSSRSIINTRDEPHADAEKYRRLHIIVGDSNMSEYATYLKVGTTALVLSMIEEGFNVVGLELEDPVKAMREISRDLTLKKRVRLEGGKEMTAIEIQRIYLEKAKEYVASEDEDEVSYDILERWEYVLNELEEDPNRLSRELDWVIKKELISSYMERKGCGWDDARVAMMDLQYHDVNQNRGLYSLLCRQDMVERIATEEDIQRAIQTPPQTTRAKVRGDFIRFAKEKNRSYTVDWTYLKLNGYWEETILCMDPFCSANQRVKELIAAAAPLNSPVRTITSFLILSLFFLPMLQAQETAMPIQVKQGEIALITLALEPDISSVTGKFLDHPIPFFKKNSGEYAAMIGIDLDHPVGLHPFVVTWKKEGSTDRREMTIEVISATFGTQTLKLPKGMVDLDPPTLARVEKEQARMKEIFNKSDDKKLWEAVFIVPTEGKVAGTFGLRRIMNGQPRNPHTGEDITAPLGTPVLASNGGRVILVGDFYFNGQSVIIDHGLGLFSMYFHLSETAVKEGETVAKGQAIGSVGQSGRATGPHLHWGVRLNGARVNPFSLVEKKLG